MEEGIVIRKHQDAAVPQQSIGHPRSQKGQSDQKAYSDTPPDKNPSVTAEGYVINGRAFVDYILHAEDMEKA